MQTYEHVNTIWEFAAKNSNARKIQAIYFNEYEMNRYKRLLTENNYPVDEWVLYKSDLVPADKKDYYTIILKGFDAQINKKFTDKKYLDPFDYIFLTPLPTEIGGSNIQIYSDRYGNVIRNLPRNLKIVLNGYCNMIEFGENVSFGANSILRIGNKSTVKIAAGCSFSMNINITMQDNASVNIEKNRFERDYELGLATNATFHVKSGGWFREFGKIIINYNCHMQIGSDILVGTNVIIRSGDGHSLFDVITGKKRNFDDNREKDTIVIGDHVWLGYDCMILNPTIIGSGSNVGAKSLVRGYYPNNCVIAGSPAGVVRKNSAWHNFYWEKNYKACGNSYAIPTIELSKVVDKELTMIRKITDIHKYLEALRKIDKKLIAISVKDTSGHFIDDVLNNYLGGIGVKSNLVHRSWQGYVALIDNDDVIYEYLSDKQSVPVEYETEHDGISVKLVSKPYSCGNKSEIFINGFDYSANYRGLNFVVFDKDSKQVVDSVCFDTYVKERTCIRKITTC